MMVDSLRLITLLFFDRALERIWALAINQWIINRGLPGGRYGGLPWEKMAMAMYECPLTGA